MRISVALVCAALAAGGCKKSGGGGGGGGWLVGSTALMAQVEGNGTLGRGYALDASVQLNGIACRYLGEAWVIGDAGTVLYTRDGGDTWTPQVVPATGNLRAVATQDDGPVYIVGDGAFLVTTDTGATWTQLATPDQHFRAVAAAQEGTAVLALTDDGTLYSYDRATGVLAPRTAFAGARAVALSPDGEAAMVAGTMLARSFTGGATWSVLDVDPAVAFDDVRLGEAGGAVAVGAAGAIAKVDASGAVALQHVGTANLHALHIPDVEDEDAVGFAAGDGGQVLITHDAGATWALGPSVGRTVYGIDEIGRYHR